MVKVVHFDEVSSDKIPLNHCPEWALTEGSWSEKDYNYRLNLCDDIFLLEIDGQIIGHLGLSEEKVASVAIDEAYQGQSLSRKLYEHVFSSYYKFSSDDAREPVADYLWKTFMKERPHQIRFNEESGVFEYCSGGF